MNLQFLFEEEKAVLHRTVAGTKTSCVPLDWTLKCNWMNEWIVQTKMAICWKQGLNDWRKRQLHQRWDEIATEIQIHRKWVITYLYREKAECKIPSLIISVFPLNCTTNPITFNILSASFPTLSRQINLMKSYEIENCNRHSLHSEICFMKKRGDWISLEIFMIWLAIMCEIGLHQRQIRSKNNNWGRKAIYKWIKRLCWVLLYSIMKIRGRATHEQLLAELDRAEHRNSTTDLSAGHQKSLWVARFFWPCWPASRLPALHGLLLVEWLARLHQSELNSQRNFRHFDEAPLNQVHIW